MNARLSGQLSARYALQLDEVWREWFDDPRGIEKLQGTFCQPIDSQDLLETTPAELWPGFMLPDSLPIVGNGYGDWWCARIGSDNSISEVVHWFHGGGDWLPIGRSVQEAAWWDMHSLQRGHEIRHQQAAHEFPLREPNRLESQSDREKIFLEWIARATRIDMETLRAWMQLARDGQYADSLSRMSNHRLCHAAVVCEWIEVSLQGKLSKLAQPSIAAHFGLNWVPEFTRWLFDTEHISAEARHAITAITNDVSFEQDWRQAADLARSVVGERGDLSWPSTILGWEAERRGDVDCAAKIYFDGRFASAFTDQSIRLRTHWFPERFGKFAIAQLHRLRDHLNETQQRDAYLNLVWNLPASRLRSGVRDYWMKQAEGAIQMQDYPAAYHAYYQAGWDLGAERLSDYREILQGLVSSAKHAGWEARAAVAETHLASLMQRLAL